MLRSKLLRIAILVFVKVVLVISQAESADKVFNTGVGGFMFVYPHDWIDITPQASGSNPQAPEIKAAVKASELDSGGANCNIVRSQDPEFKDLSLPKTKEDLFDVFGSDFCKETLPSWQDAIVEYDGTTFIDNIPAILCKASGTSKSMLGTFRMKSIYAILVKPPNAYSIGCYVEESEYDAMEPTFINILGSFGFNY
jgi:hypothetical protein